MEFANLTIDPIFIQLPPQEHRRTLPWLAPQPKTVWIITASYRNSGELQHHASKVQSTNLEHHQSVAVMNWGFWLKREGNMPLIGPSARQPPSIRFRIPTTTAFNKKNGKKIKIKIPTMAAVTI